MASFNASKYGSSTNWLKGHFGQNAYDNQWVLTGMDISLLPNNGRAGGPLADSLTSHSNGPWTAAGITYTVTPQPSPTQTYQLTAKTVGDTHYFDVKDAWNYGVKNAFIESGVAQNLRFDGFVHVDINVAICDRQCNGADVPYCTTGSLSGNSNILINGSKRGNVVTGDGNDTIRVNLISNGPEWSNEWRMNTGCGDDCVTFAPFTYDGNTDPTYMGNGAGLITDGKLTTAWVNLGAGNDCFNGFAEKDIVWGGTGNDKLFGGAGNDTLYGEDGDDRIDGGADQDCIYGGKGCDVLNGQAGQDVVYGEDGDDTIYGDSGDDKLYGGKGNDTIFAGVGNDYVEGNDGNDCITGSSDQDTIYGGAGQDCIDGQAGQDKIFGDDGNDLIWGDTGDDCLSGGNGNDSLYGEAGFDTIYGGAGKDVIDGGDHADKLYGGNDDDAIDGGNGDDRIEGGEGNDALLGNCGNDTIYGGNGNDYAHGGTEKDWLEGNDGNDKLNTGLYSFDITDAAAEDIFCNCEKDWTQYLNGAERGYGGNGNDSLASTGEGSTKDGADIFVGGAGCDLFVFGCNYGHDLITDFNARDDKLMFQDLNASSSDQYIFARVNFNGGNDDLVIFKDNGSGDPDFANFVLLRDFFTTNNGLIDVSKYDNMVYSATELAALGSNNIVALEGGSYGNATNYF